MRAVNQRRRRHVTEYTTRVVFHSYLHVLVGTAREYSRRKVPTGWAWQIYSTLLQLLLVATGVSEYMQNGVCAGGGGAVLDLLVWL